MANDYLPGINVTLNDLGLKVAPPPAGPKLTLMGITSNPSITLREPFTVSSVEKAVNSLYFDFSGTAFPGGMAGVSGRLPGELALAIEEASAAGAQNIEVIAIGCYSGTSLQNYLRADADPTGRYVDLSGAYDVLRNRDVDFIVPVNAYMDTPFTGSSASSYSFAKQLANFCYQATKESSAAHGVIAVRNPIEWACFHRSGIAASSALLSGELVSMFGQVATTGAFTTNAQLVTQSQAVNFGTPSSSLVDSWYNYHIGNSSLQYNSYYTAWQTGACDQAGNKLDSVSDTTASSVSAGYFPYWQAVGSDGTSAVDSRGGKVDAGAFISVFTAPLKAVGTLVKGLALGVGASPALTSRNTSAAAAYAGKALSLAPQSATTNKSIEGLVQSRLLSASQANQLTGMRHVTMYSRTKGLVVAKGITGAHNVTRYVRSDYTNLTTFRIVAAVVDLIRSVGDKYIGESNTAEHINALDAEIGQVLLSLKSQNALNDYSFSISSTPDQRVLGIVDINLTLVPAFEIQDINLVVSLSKEL